MVKIPRSTWASVVLLMAREIRHLHLLENHRLHLSTSLDNLEATISVKNLSQLPRNCNKVLFWSFYPWCHLVHNTEFHSLMLKHVNVTVPHSSEECSPPSYSVSFPKVDSNSNTGSWCPSFGIPSPANLREEPEYGPQLNCPREHSHGRVL